VEAVVQVGEARTREANQSSVRPVVVGVDGSGNSRLAARLAAEEARRRNAPLRLLFALDSPFSERATLAPGSRVPDALHDSAAEVLRSVEAAVAPDVGADHTSWSVLSGRPVELLRAASAEAQLVVLGARGAGGVGGLVLGSTANGVVAGASSPVIVVPDDTAVTVSERRSVVVGVRGRSDDEVLAFAFDETAARDTDLIAVHTWQDTEVDPAFLAISPLIDWARVRDAEEGVLAEALTGWRDKRPDVVVREVVLRDKPARGLVAAALTAELLVVGHHRRNRLAALTSTTHGVLHRAPCPVAVVPIGSGQED
jgi:nucleotide-binding universal stress UspA family protein